MDQVWDAGGEASLALARVVQGFGVPVLGQADLLEGLLNDEVPELPREVAMLTEAARYGIAELLTERVRQGISAQAAASMVATEMTSRTAVDSVGARWAAQKFATVIGLQLTGTAATMPITDPGRSTLPTGDPLVPPAADPPAPPAASPPAASPPPVPAPPVPDARGAVPATRLLDSGPAITGSAFDAAGDATVLPGQSTVFGPPPGQVSPLAGTPLPPGQLATGQLAFGPAAGSKLGRAAAALTLLAVVLLLAWAVFPRSHAQVAVFWLGSLVLLAGGVAVAIWSARDEVNGFGLAAVLGIGLPVMSWSLLDASFAPELTSFSHGHRDVLLAASVLALLAAGAAVAIAFVTLTRRRQLAPQPPGMLAVVLLILGVAYPLTNLLPQIKFDGTGFGNVLGHSGKRPQYRVSI